MLERTLARQMGREEATDLIGGNVPAKRATVTEEGLYRDAETGEALLIYAPFPGDVKALKWAADVPMGTVRRAASGFASDSRTFGFSPRSTVLQRESCRPTGYALEHADGQRILAEAAVTMENWLAELLPEERAADAATTSDIADEWRMTAGTLWTSGVINRLAALPYHRDRFNFDCWSAMPVVRRQVRGGYLDIPEYGATLECRDGWVMAFRGYQHVHGVTPMRAMSAEAYRYSVVYYCLRGMKDCYTAAVEQRRGREVRTAREQEMAK